MRLFSFPLLLALVGALRIGRAREKEIAIRELKIRILGEDSITYINTLLLN